MSRSGFDAPRLRTLEIDAPSPRALPPVSADVAVADQVRDVLAAAGQAAFIVGRNARIASAEEDEQNRGVAFLQAQRDLAPLGTQIEEEVLSRAANGDAIDDDALAALVESKIASGLGNLTVNEAGAEQYRRALTDNLTGAAFRAREQAVLKARADSLADASNAFASVRSADDFARVSSSLKAIDPTMSETEIRSRAVPAMQAAAQTGDREAFEALSGSIGDTPEVRVARWHLANAEEAREAELRRAHYDAAQDVYSSYLTAENFTGAREFLSKAGITSSQRRSLLDDLDAREASFESEQEKLALTELGDTLTTLSAAGDEAGFQSAVKRAFDSGLVTQTDVAGFNASYGSQLARTLESRAQVAVNQLRGATSDEERKQAFQSIGDVLSAADAGLAREPGTLGRIEQDQYSEIVRIAEPVLEEMQNIDFKQQAAVRLLSESETARGAEFGDVRLGSDVWTAAEQAKLVADTKWQMIQATVEDPAERVKSMTDWLSKNPAATWSDLERQYQGFVGRAFGAVLATDDPARMRNVLDEMAYLATIAQENYDVAARHAGPAIDLLDVVGVLHSTLPMEDSDAVASALRYLMAEQSPAGAYKLTAADEQLIDEALANVGLGDDVENVRAIRSEAYARAKTLATATGARVDLMAKQIADGYRATHRVSHGWAVKVGDLGLAQSIDYEIVDKVVRGVYREQYGSADGLVFRPHFDGRWRLFERHAIVPVEGSPNLNGRDLRRISGTYRDAARIIAEHEGFENALLERTQIEVGNNTGLRNLGDRITSLDPVGAVAAIPGAIRSAVARMTSSRILADRHERWARQFLDQNTRELDEFERFALELHRNPEPDPGFNERLRESDDVPNVAKAFLRP